MRLMKIIISMSGFLAFMPFGFANVALDELAQLEKQKTVSMPMVAAPKSFTIQANHFSQHHVLVLFFSSTCQFCHAFSPVVKQWSHDKGYALEAYTINGAGLPEFPKPQTLTPPLRAMYFAQSNVVVPALFLVNLKNNQAYPVSVGYLNEQELDGRMQRLINAVKQYEQRGNMT